MKLKRRKVLKNKRKYRADFPYISVYANRLICFYSIGEIYELKAELNSDKRDRKKEAVKKVNY